jgi:hypothetical protein
VTDAPKLAVKDLRSIVADAGELSKGVAIADGGGLSHLSRFETKLYADAKGSGASPYKVQIAFDDKGAAKGRCSCMAARSRPFCKHAAALLVSWARSPEAFAVADQPPAGAMGDRAAKKREVKKGKTESGDLMRGGVEQVSTLVRELAVSGVAAMAADRAEQVRALGEGLREAKLRRLSARSLNLARMLGVAARRGEGFDAEEYAELLGDLLLTARKLEKHLGGEALEDRHVEELIGKTWTKKDRKPIDGLDLVEYAFVSRVTLDDFVIRESRFVELKSGAHYSEKQILPGFLAKRTPPKPSHFGRVLRNASGSIYPSYSPVRLDLAEHGDVSEVGASDLALFRERALPGVAAALALLQEHKKDVFAPDALPVSIAADTVLAEGMRMQIADRTDAAIFLPEERRLVEDLAAALRRARLLAICGDLVLDGALPTLLPHAVLVDAEGVLELRPLARVEPEEITRSRKLKKREPDAPKRAETEWTETARAAGLSTAAVALGEVRAEMAELFTTGLVSVGPRRVDPLVSRLRDLGLNKQADLLAELPQRSDPAERLDDFVKLHQVLGIALSRLAGAVRVDRAELTSVPTYESVQVRAPSEELTPREVARRVGKGELNRFQAAVRYARHYERLDPDELADDIYPTWADGSAAPFVVRALRGRGESILEASRRALGLDAETRFKPKWRRPLARVAAITAVQVLEANPEVEGSRRLLIEAARHHSSPTVRGYAVRAIENLDRQKPGGIVEALRKAIGGEPEADRAQKLIELRERLMSGADKDVRVRSAYLIAEHALVEAIPYLRASFAGDVSRDVRRASALALARIGDTEMLEDYVRMLEDRKSDPDDAKTAAYALGALGDVRGIETLLDAWSEVWQPAIVGEAMREMGSAVIEPLVLRIEAQPQLLKRKAATSVLEAMPASELERVLVERVEAVANESDFVGRAATLLELATIFEVVAKAVAGRIAAVKPELSSDASKEGKALAKKVKKYSN